jgi:hypothetical protein
MGVPGTDDPIEHTRRMMVPVPPRYSHRYGLHWVYDANRAMIGTFHADGCWPYLPQHGLVEEAA